MNRLEKMLSKWNFKKIAVWYLVLAVITGVLCGGTVGYLYRQRLKFAWQYARLEEAKTPEALRMAADKTAAASEDVVDILVVDENQQILYSAKDSKFAAGPLTLTKVGDAKKYLASADYPEAVFLQVKGDEFMLNSIVSHDFGKIRSEYDDESAFENGLSAKTVYMLNRVQVRKAGGIRHHPAHLCIRRRNGFKGHGGAGHAAGLRLLGAGGPVDVSGRGPVQALSPVLGAHRPVYQPHRPDRLQNLQAQRHPLPRLRRGSKRRTPVLLLLRRSVGSPLRQLRRQGGGKGQFLPPLRQQDQIKFIASAPFFRGAEFLFQLFLRKYV